MALVGPRELVVGPVRSRRDRGHRSLLSTIESRRNYNDVVSHRVNEPADGRQALKEFFAERSEPRSAKSSFTPERVAEIVRRDRDASD